MTIVIKAGRASYYDGRKHHYYTLGQTADIPEPVAARWVSRGLAAYVDVPVADEPDDAEPVDVEAEPEDDGPGDPYADMGMTDLRTEAKSRGIKIPRGTSKADLADMLRADDARGFDALEPVDAE